ncbi:hypothetical protein [Micromonospora peucetia]|uniref:Uncharacterized protein n=1 Tax=Micromonospora peucetia TaxID=47871 RepID=A0ABZ1EJZ1_9ACTN|nr:hypothetical protein [Micromonospora peucetia]WSA34563.1 hypothetical protein OIE14_11215 [Micromonospora peucetia]
MSDDLTAWFGPAADDLTAEQIERVAEAARGIDERYPDPDEQADRDAALSAVVQYLLGDTTAENANRALIDARRREREAYVAALQFAVLLAGDGVPDATAARRAGVDRMRLLKALGKR